MWMLPMGAAAVAVAGIAVARPLGTYALTLALFGLAHVLSELRYVDLRFGSRLGTRLKIALGLLLVAVVADRTGLVLGVFPKEWSVPVELLLIALLAVAAALAGSGPLRMFGVLVAGLLGFAALYAPFHVMVVLAILHNLTPLAFFAERLDGPQRGPALAFAAVTLLGVPLVIATGLPALALGSVVDPTPQMSAFVHVDWQHLWWAPNLFAAAVYGQCAHYVATIGVMPRLVEDGARGTFPWPSMPVMAAGMVVLGAPLLVGFWIDFAEARSVYGIVAAVHAWIEIPLLLLALSPPKS